VSNDQVGLTAHETFVSIEVERAVVMAFRREAIARDTSVPCLIRNLLDVISSEHLTSAILDDEGR
jgi:hypothetical protein